MIQLFLFLLSLLPSALLQGPLEGEAMRLGEAWVVGDLQTLESMLSTGGVRLDLQGAVYASVSVPRALVALEAFLDRYPGGYVELMRASRASGENSRGFAELHWGTLVAGTGEAVDFTLFLAFAMEDQAWAVTEIRVLP